MDVLESQSDDVIKLFHQGALKNGQVSRTRALSTSMDNDLSHYHPDGILYEFHVPRSIFVQWVNEGIAIPLRDFHQLAEKTILEYRILPPGSGQLNQFLVTGK